MSHTDTTKVDELGRLMEEAVASYTKLHGKAAGDMMNFMLRSIAFGNAMMVSMVKANADDADKNQLEVLFNQYINLVAAGLAEQSALGREDIVRAFKAADDLVSTAADVFMATTGDKDKKSRH